MKPWSIVALVLTVAAITGGLVFWVQEYRKADAVEEAWDRWDAQYRETIKPDTLTNVPTVVKPNPVKVVVVKDPLQTRVVDSLIASGASKDSLIRALGSGWYAEQSWNTTKDSAYIVGRLHVYYFPPDREMDTAVLVDSVAVPARVIEIIREREVERVSWPWVVIGFGAGVMLGSYAVHEMHK